MVEDFPHGVTLVIGGSGGVGQAVCRRLAESGSDVVLTYHGNEAGAQEAAAQVIEVGRRVTVRQLSLRDPASVGKLIHELEQQGERIHTVVDGAGYDISQKLIADLDPEEWRAVLDTELTGFLTLAQATIPHMRERGGGSFVHIGSAGLQRWPELDALSVAPKAAVGSLINGIAKEEGRHGIRANAIAMGVIEAGIFLRLKDEVFDESWHKAVHSKLCLKRYGQPEEVADAVVFLASRRAGYITGQMIAVDGGYGV